MYSSTEPDLYPATLDLLIGEHAVACMNTAADLYGFGLETAIRCTSWTRGFGCGPLPASWFISGKVHRCS